MNSKELNANQTKENLKFPVGALLLIIHELFWFIDRVDNLTSCFSNSSLLLWGLLLWAEFASTIALAVVLFIKKRKLVIFPAAALATLTLINLIVEIRYYISNVLPLLINIIIPLCIILLSLCGKKQSNKKVQTIFLCILAIPLLISALAFFRDLLDIFTHYHIGTRLFHLLGQYFPRLMMPVIYDIAFLFIGLWLANPYKKKKTSVSTNTPRSEPADENYISLGKHVCLLLLTFGIWQLIWIYRTTKYTNLAQVEEERNPTNKLLLCMFVPFYLIYWTYKTALRIDKMAKAKNTPSELGTICLILAIFIGIVPPILMQEKINKLIDGSGIQKSNDVASMEAIEKCKELLDKGIITKEEFEAKKKQLLGL